jgi:AcrR family transcriptional regulator
MTSSSATTRRRRADGQRTRQAILEGATELATLDGLDGLSIGRLAAHIGLSKSGLYAHFGSKEELQLATIAAAEEIFDREVAAAAREREPGVAQLLGFCEAYLSYLERGVFPGGCFFASANTELDTHEGPVKERLRELMAASLDAFAAMVREAQARGEVGRGTDPEQLAFEIDALLHAANAGFVMLGGEEPLQRARRGIHARLGRP